MIPLEIPPTTVTAEDGGESFLLDVRTRRYYRLNETGAEIWRALRAKREPLAALRSRYPSVPAGALERDIDALCAALLEAGLVERPCP